MKKRKRTFGEKINFKSLSCAPINELGVVYLFGVLHDALDFKIESIQAGFPDCIARRQVSQDRWEELRIEFEFDSYSFVKHKHDPDGVDMIVCWKHNWKECPEHIEIIELSKLINSLESISSEIAHDEKKLTAYNKFTREKRLEGYTFKEIAVLWQQNKNETEKQKTVKSNNDSTTWKEFCKIKRKEGLSFKEISELWRAK